MYYLYLFICHAAIVTTLSPTTISSYWKALRVSVNAPQVWLALSRAYARDGMPWQAAYAARLALRCDASLHPQLSAFNEGHWEDPVTSDQLFGRDHPAGAAVLIAQFSACLKQDSGDWLSWLYLARLYDMQDQQDATASALDQAVRFEVVAGESHHWLGVWRLRAGDATGAVKAFSALLDIRPLRYGSMMHLGEALIRTGNHPAAEKAFSRASLSSNPSFLQQLAAAAYAHNYWQEAIAILRKALALQPAEVPIWLALAKTQSEVYDLADCRDSLQQVRTLQPDNPEALLLEAGLRGRMGDARGHLQCLHRAYRQGGDPLSRLASGIAMTSLYHDTLTPAGVAALHGRLCAPIEAAVMPQRDFPNLRNSNRRLRVGYITGDLHRQHPVNIFMLPILQRHQRSVVEICIYYTGTMHDTYTRQAMACAGHWTDAAHLDDAALRSIILADGIDLLIDLAGHTSTHRLGVFALRAAPVQATFLGYPHSTGLTTMDWIIGDPVVTPADHATLFSEGLAQLPDSVFCWAPVDHYPLPAARTTAAPLVFGSFNNAMKLNSCTIALWARVLQAVPDALLLLKAPSLRDQEVRARFIALFAGHGVASGRLILRGPTGLTEMMQEYGDVDIALDPSPYNGGTTSLQALWMGVPLVTLAGGNFVSRMGTSFLHTLGQPEWIGADADGFVLAAVQLAQQRDTVRAARASLRAKMAASPLCAIDSYVRNMEALFFRMWKIYCDDGTERVIEANSYVVEFTNDESTS
ncbi:MAG: protein O-GlcNAc transferase [Bradyrhizobium sp.]|jgi:protein O-GlcNAc transferase